MPPRPWLILLAIGTATVVTFAFFILRLQPIRTAPATNDASALPSVTAPVVTFADPATGAKDPRVTIVEYADFQCIPCRNLSENLKAVMRSYPDTVRLVWKDMPNEAAHPMATLAAIAAGCAGRQGRFWQYHDLLFDRQLSLSEDEFFSIATSLELNIASFRACYETHDTLAVVRRGYEEGMALKILATPTIYIGSESYSGELSVEDLSTLIQAELANTEKTK